MLQITRRPDRSPGRDTNALVGVVPGNARHFLALFLMRDRPPLTWRGLEGRTAMRRSEPPDARAIRPDAAAQSQRLSELGISSETNEIERRLHVSDHTEI